jgi:hypothetical protein
MEFVTMNRNLVLALVVAVSAAAVWVVSRRFADRPSL